MQEQGKLYGAMENLLRWQRYFPHDKKGPLTDRSREDLEKKLAEADDLAEIAESMWARHEYDKAVDYADRALGRCIDHPRAPGIKENGKKRNQGLDLLSQAEEILLSLKEGNADEIEKARLLIRKVLDMGVSFRNLKAQGYSFNSPEDFLRKLESLSGLDTVFFLSIKPGDTYLVFLDDQVRIGSPRDENAELKIQAGGMKNSHARLIREKETFRLEKETGNCTVDGGSVEKHLLKPGQEIGFGRFPFGVASLYEGTMVLETADMDLPDSSVYGVVLMKAFLDIGPARNNCHIYAPRMKSQVRLELRNRKIIVCHGGKRSPLMPGKRWEKEGVEISIRS